MRRVSIGILALVTAATLCGEAAALAKEQVPGLQVALYRYGYYKGAIDGIPGPMTDKALRDFQRRAGLDPDGVAGKQTRKALGRFGRPLFGVRTMRRGDVGFDVSVLQFLLAKRGFPPKRLNSNFGPLTEELVRKFQAKAGLPVDGIVGRKTRAALLGVEQTKRAATPARRHVVRPGETLTSIAARTGSTVDALARRNGIERRDLLLVGTRLLVPRARSSASRTDVKASLARWSAHYGVPADLARALAWQESGFQNHVRSDAGATGVMQVTAPTWAFVEQFVIGLRVARTADGNVRVGVAYLDHLLGLFDGNVRRALGAYYQGPASVKKDGLFAETKRFVANVLALRGRV